MNYSPDPGGNFASDVHRRVAGHLPLPSEDPTSVTALLLRIAPDPLTPLDEDSLTIVLEDLASSEDAKGTASGWKLTAAGRDALCGAIANEPPPLKGAALKAAEASDDVLAEEEAEIIQRAKDERFERLKAELAEVEAE